MTCLEKYCSCRLPVSLLTSSHTVPSRDSQLRPCDLCCCFCVNLEGYRQHLSERSAGEPLPSGVCFPSGHRLHLAQRCNSTTVRTSVHPPATQVDPSITTGSPLQLWGPFPGRPDLAPRGTLALLRGRLPNFSLGGAAEGTGPRRDGQGPPSRSRRGAHPLPRWPATAQIPRPPKRL